MNLIFHILWFDDTEDFFHSLDLEPFSDQVIAWGFEAEVELVTTAEDFMKEEPWAKYDLIVVDYNLGEKIPHGEEFIKRVRNHNVYTEVIFYSTNPSSDLWKLIQERQLEGVFVANRQVILQKLESVAHQAVHKVLDLNNMRGMVMAEVGDIDQILDDILKLGVAELEAGKRGAIFAKFHKRATEQVQDTLKRLEQFAKDPTAETMLELSDSYKRWINFTRLQGQHKTVQGFPGGDYAKDVLFPRNYLAHGTARETVGGYIFEYQGKEYRFDQEVGLGLRKTILLYKRQFREIHKKLTKKGS